MEGRVAEVICGLLAIVKSKSSCVLMLVLSMTVESVQSTVVTCRGRLESCTPISDLTPETIHPQ